MWWEDIYNNATFRETLQRHSIKIWGLSCIRYLLHLVLFAYYSLVELRIIPYKYQKNLVATLLLKTLG